MKSKILLCCLTPFGTPESIDEFLIYQIFKQYIIVKNIKIFSRDSLVKAFLLAEDEFSVTKAIESLNDVQLNVGKVNVYSSHKAYIAFDRTLKEIIQQAYQRDNNETESLFSNIDESRKKIEYLISKKSSQRTIESLGARKPRKQEIVRISADNEIPSNHYNNLDSESDDEFDIKNISDNKFHPFIYRKEKQTEEHGMIKYDLSKLSKEQVSKKIQLDLSPRPKKTSMVKISGIDARKVNFVAILNFFGCFGNVKRLLTNFKENYSVLDFESTEQAKMIVKNVSDTVFFKNTLKASFFFEVSIFDELLINPDPNIKTRTNHPKFYRYKKNLNIKINKPTRLLHFTNLPERITPIVLYQLIGQICDPINIFKLAKRGTTSDMFLVEFEELHESIEVLSILHNKKVDNKLVKVSFSHTKIEDKQ